MGHPPCALVWLGTRPSVAEGPPSPRHPPGSAKDPSLASSSSDRWKWIPRREAPGGSRSLYNTKWDTNNLLPLLSVALRKHSLCSADAWGFF